MTMVPQYKKCPICRKYYSWNPDVGDMSCPNCRVGITNEILLKIKQVIGIK